MLYSTGVQPGTEGVRGCSRRGSYWYVQIRQADRLGLWVRVRVRFRVGIRGMVDRDNTTTDCVTGMYKKGKLIGEGFGL